MNIHTFTWEPSLPAESLYSSRALASAFSLTAEEDGLARLEQHYRKFHGFPPSTRDEWCVTISGFCEASISDDPKGEKFRPIPVYPDFHINCHPELDSLIERLVHVASGLNTLESRQRFIGPMLLAREPDSCALILIFTKVLGTGLMVQEVDGYGLPDGVPVVSEDDGEKFEAGTVHMSPGALLNTLVSFDPPVIFYEHWERWQANES